MSDVTVRLADLNDPSDRQAIVDLLDQYASEPIGGETPLSMFVKSNLANELQKRPHVVVVLALANERYAGMIIAIEGFSTFACKPVLNLHDVIVEASHRGQGVFSRMLEFLESEAARRGCCKLTLEVLAGNRQAADVYRHLGFVPYCLSETFGEATFWHKVLDA